MTRRYWTIAPIALALSFAVAAIGGSLTDLGPWYQSLTQPAWKPPDWAFGPAWTIIFLLCAVAGTIAWANARGARDRKLIILVFGVNALLNVLWSALFFTFKMPLAALIEVPILWLSVLAATVVCWRIARPAGLALVPYLAWVAFAATINTGVVLLNP